jgi:hypothetical protein
VDMGVDEPGNHPGTPEVMGLAAPQVPEAGDDPPGDGKGGLLPGAVEGIEEGAAGKDGIGRPFTRRR